jgi:hypothetical protein
VFRRYSYSLVVNIGLRTYNWPRLCDAITFVINRSYSSFRSTLYSL